MKLPWLIFGLLLVMCGSVTVLLLTPEPTIVLPGQSDVIVAGHGIPHPSIATMQQGGDGEQRYAPIRAATWVFAVCMVVFFTALLALASRRQQTNRLQATLLWTGCLVHLFSMVGMLRSYEAYLFDAAPSLYAGFPAPTAWMLYVLWPAPLWFVVLYVIGFDRWTFRPEDELAFQELMRRSGVPSSPAKDQD
jgi:hypothetical protein